MKTPIRRLDSLTHNDTAATKLINDNFEALQQGIEDALSRSGKTPNYMDAPLDMNMNRIINIATPVDDYDLANKKYVDDSVANIQDQLDAEVTRAKAAEKAITDTLKTYGDVVTHDADEFATAAQGALADTALQPSDLGNATLTIKKNNTSVGTFTANSKTDTDINITVPTSAAEVNALPDSTKYGASISLSLDSSTYVLTVQLKDQDGSNLGTAATIDIPSESVIVSGYYDSATKSIVLVLDSGDTITIPVGDLVSGLQSEITSSNKLDADLVDDSTSTNKFVTASEKTAWDGKQNAITGAISNMLYSNSPTGRVVISDSYGKLATSAVTALELQKLTGVTTNVQQVGNLVTSVDSSSTDSQYPSAKLFYDTCGDIETLINAL